MTDPAAAASPETPVEIAVSEARAILGELAEAAASGKVIHLTKHGKRIAALVPEHSPAHIDEAFVAAGDRIREHYREMFDRLAEL